MSEKSFKFRNIDDFVPGRFEQMGMLKGKRWYTEMATEDRDGKLGLFKPQRKEFGDKKVFCGNHYGEFIGYVAATCVDVPVCKVELAHLSKYYENIHKARHHGTPESKDGCISFAEKSLDQELEHGTSVIDFFRYQNPEEFERITKNDSRNTDRNDNLEVCLAAIEYRIRRFLADHKDCPAHYIDKKVRENRALAIQMIVYDCMYGNNDRHDENWAMIKDRYGRDISLYKLYDNERVFGLYENQNFIEKAIATNTVEETSEIALFSRMHIPGATKKHSSYKEVLTYIMDNYTAETKQALSNYFDRDTQFLLQSFLKSCEGLPDCYIEFQRQMYKARYDFAKGLYLSKSALSHTEERENEETR